MLDLFVTKMTNVYFLQIIKSNSEALVKYAFSSVSRLLIVFFATGADILNTTYHVFPYFRISGQKAQISSQVSSLHTGIYLRILSRYLVVRGY